MTPLIWKQAMLILLVLFPIVMLEIKYLPFLTKEMNPALATFIGNAISVALLTWPLLPIAMHCLDWWLFPKEQLKTQLNLLGAGLVLLFYIIEIFVLWNFL